MFYDTKVKDYLYRGKRFNNALYCENGVLTRCWVGSEYFKRYVVEV